jgi:predicted O-methyltransferase YrrM
MTNRVAYLKVTLARVGSIVSRVLKNPTLVSEIWRKASSRVIDPQHRSRIDNYEAMHVAPPKALSRLLGVEMSWVEECMAAASLQALLTEVEAIPSATEPARSMRGAAYLEVCYAITRISRPRTVIETGVALGFSSASVLQALEDNGEGKLYSVDLPAFRPGTIPHTGKAVPSRLRTSMRWQLTLGPDRRVLPRLLERVGPADLFFYDSDKSYRGMLHTWSMVWRYLSPGALFVADDVHVNDAFLEFSAAQGLDPLIIVKPKGGGVYRWNTSYYVGLLRKPE